MLCLTHRQGRCEPRSADREADDARLDPVVGSGRAGRRLVVAALAPAGLNRQPLRTARRAALNPETTHPLEPDMEAPATLQIFSDYV